MANRFRDWGEASEKYDELRYNLSDRDLSDANEAQTRFDIVDRMIREVLGWQHGQIQVEEAVEGVRRGFIDYVLRSGDSTVLVEAKRTGSTFPSPTRKTQLKLSGSLLSNGHIGDAIAQATNYASKVNADLAVVTNGACWCVFSPKESDKDSFATLLFPLAQPKAAERLFEILAEASVEGGSAKTFIGLPALPENRLISSFSWADSRIDRNSIAAHIMPALERALYADALLSDPEQLERCFVRSEARIKYDELLKIHIVDPKKVLNETARRVRTGQEGGPLEQLVRQDSAKYAPPVTLVIGSVGSGKSTYLKHFELVTGRARLKESRAHWIYIDFEAMGQSASPRRYMYEQLLSFIDRDNGPETLDYRGTIAPAYAEEIAAMKRGIWAPISNDKDEVNRRITDRIEADRSAVEPYVDKILAYLATRGSCVVVLDNIDLYEDEELETKVFSEGLALSRRVKCNVLVSLRDRTFVRHRTDSVFDAYELNKLWIDPPPLKAVIASRLSYSRSILSGKSARIPMANGMTLNVPDLGVFFDIVQRSILGGQAGDFVDAVSDGNIRRGLTLVRNFLTSGHIQADRALRVYLHEQRRNFVFPFHEVFKGTMLGQWAHFREERSECVNIFDARLGSSRLRLLRLFLLNDLWLRAQEAKSLEASIESCHALLSGLGASVDHLVETCGELSRHGLIRVLSSGELGAGTKVALTRSGAFYVRGLARRMVYVEECMYDTSIYDPHIYDRLAELTRAAREERYSSNRMAIRCERLRAFVEYLIQGEAEARQLLPHAVHLYTIEKGSIELFAETEQALQRARRYDSDGG